LSFLIVSHRTYDQIWRDTANVLVEQVENELPADAALIPKDNDSKLQHYQSLYVKYVQIFKRLEVSNICGFKNGKIIKLEHRSRMIKLFILKKDVCFENFWLE
jgi:calcineurin-like phosphoesterase family protein